MIFKRRHILKRCLNPQEAAGEVEAEPEAEEPEEAEEARQSELD